jgi:hypothetical protein
MRSGAHLLDRASDGSTRTVARDIPRYGGFQTQSVQKSPARCRLGSRRYSRVGSLRYEVRLSMRALGYEKSVLEDHSPSQL